VSGASSSEQATVTLRALEGDPLRHAMVRDMTVATANAIAERSGVKIINLRTDDRSVTITIAGTRLGAMGLAAELRRLTTAWYAHKFGVDALWGEARMDGDDDAGEEWKKSM
jgi:hypothetical protein